MVESVMPGYFMLSGFLYSKVIGTITKAPRTLTIEQTVIVESPFLETLIRKE